jgi:hypothetical protein
MSPSPPRTLTPYRRVGRVARSLWRGAKAFGFWTAVFLPAAYPAALVAGAWLSESRAVLVLLLGVHLLALVVGQGYERGTPDR